MGSDLQNLMTPEDKSKKKTENDERNMKLLWKK